MERLINRIQSFIIGSLLLIGCTLVVTLNFRARQSASLTHGAPQAMAPQAMASMSEMSAVANESLVIRAASQASPTLLSTVSPTVFPTLSPTLRSTMRSTLPPTSTSIPIPTASPAPPQPRPTNVPLPTLAPQAAPVAGYSFTPQETLLVDLLNQARRENGLGPLLIAAELNASARRHSVDMAVNGLTWHTGSDGSIAAQRILDAGYLDASATEMISYGHPSAAAAVDWWLRDADHRPFILSAQYTEVGVSHTWTDNTDFGHYWVVNLGNR